LVRIMTDKVFVVGTVVSTMACTMCFPAVAGIGAAIGLGFLSHWEHLFIKALPLFAALVLVTNGSGWITPPAMAPQRPGDDRSDRRFDRVGFVHERCPG
jgi:MerC mercury resistance protein.